MQKKAISCASPDPAAILGDSETNKNSYAAAVCKEAGIDFLPLAADTFGGFGAQAEEALHEVSKNAKLLRGASAPTATQLRQRLQVAVMRGVARQLLRRLTYPEEADGDHEAVE